MLEIADRLLALLRGGEPVAVATCIDLVGSSPYGTGSSLAVGSDGVPIGSVSGGCVESSALAGCAAALAGAPAVVRRYGFGGAEAGPACGGEVDVLTHVLHGEDAARVARQLERRLDGRPAAIALVTGGPPALLGRVLPSARPVAGLRVFVDAVGAAPRMLLLGGTETATATAAAASAAGFAVTVGDVDPAFAAPARFPAARRVLAGRPDGLVAAFAPAPADAICLLGHDEDLDPLALAAALESAAGFVGAQGSRGTTARRIERLRALGVDEQRLARLHAPLGLDLGARTPSEVAAAIVAEVLAARSGASGQPLHRTDGPLRSRAGSGGKPGSA